MQTKKTWRIGMLAAVVALAGACGAPYINAQEADQPQRLSAEFIPEGAMASGFVFVQEILTAPQLKLMPIEVARAWTVENVGIDLQDVDSVTAVVGVPGPQGVEFGFVLELSSEFNIAQLKPQLVAGPAEAVGGYQAIPLAGVPNVYAHQADPRTVLVATSGFLVDMLASKEPRGPLGLLVSRLPRISPVMVAAAMEPIRPQINQVAAQAAGQLPPPIRDLMELPNLLDGVVVAAGLSADGSFRLMMLATDEEAATDAEMILNNAIQFGHDLALVQSTQAIQGAGPVPDAMRAYFKRLADEVAALVKPARNDNRVMIEIENSKLLTLSGSAVGFMVPAIQSISPAGRRMESANNLKQIMLAMHNYHDTYRHLPEAISRDEDGKPLLSWRVAILPFIEEQALYEQFHLDEPWDSEHNIKLLDRMPQTYMHPEAVNEAGTTVYQVPLGEPFMFIPDGSTGFRDITDGLSNTIAVLETDAESAVPWTKPQDIEIDLEKPLDHLGGMTPGGFNVGLGDGSVRFISDAIDAGLFRALLTRGGGEVVQGF